MYSVDRWAENLGTELWDLAHAVARPDELKAVRFISSFLLLSQKHKKKQLSRINFQRYKSMNTRVEDKSGEELINIISESVGRMLRRKMDAVRCILAFAENAAEEWNFNFTGPLNYTSSKYSNITNQDEPPEIPENMQNSSYIYM